MGGKISEMYLIALMINSSVGRPAKRKGVREEDIDV